MVRPERPKPFLPLLGGRSLFRCTLDRVVPLVDAKRILVVTGRRQVPWVRKQAPEIAPRNIVEEAEGRGTTTAVALAAEWIRAVSGDGVMIVLPADHWVRPVRSFRVALRRAVVEARRTNGLITLGVRARGIDTGLGHIVPGAAPRTHRGARPVARFVEKPAAALAARLVRSRAVYWNSGIFVWTVSAIRRELQRWQPGSARAIARWAARRRGGRWRVPGPLLRRVPLLPIDRAVLERTDRLYVLPATFRWSDLGTWTALAGRAPRDRRGNAVLGRLIALDARRCFAVSETGVIVLVGVNDVIAVRCGEDVLVCHRRSSQRVRDAVNALAKSRHRDGAASG